MKLSPQIAKVVHVAMAGVLLATAYQPRLLAQNAVPAFSGPIQRVLLISVDGMHALDYLNCAAGIGGTPGTPTCPNLVSLAKTGVNYVRASAAQPSDSFPGLAALITGASARNSGFFYDVAYDRALSPPAQTTPSGVPGGANLCPSVVGTQVAFDESIDIDSSKIDGGGGINPAYLPRDPKNNCAPVYPHSFLRQNTFFEVVKAAGGYTAWSDKHPAYDYVQGPSGKGVDDLASPEVDSTVIALPNVPGCTSIADPTASLSAWTGSFSNIRCYDSIKVQTILNWIDGLKSDGKTPARVPNAFGMNFQAVSVGQKLNQKSNKTVGGYLDPKGTPSPALLQQIQFVDASIGRFVAELKKQGLLQSTLIIISAKHGQSPIDPAALNRIPADSPNMMAPSDVLGDLVGNASEDDVSLIWLKDQSQTENAVQMLSKQLKNIGGGEIFYGNSLTTWFNSPATDSRTPDILVLPNVGTVYTGGTKKISEHGGFANDDINVIMLVSNPAIPAGTWSAPVRTTQVAQTIVASLGLNPMTLQSSTTEGTQPLPGFALAGSPIVSIQKVSDVSTNLVVLDASKSVDPFGSPLSFTWTNPTNNAAISGGNTATPQVQLGGGRGQYQFNVTATNSTGLSTTGSVTFNYR